MLSEGAEVLTRSVTRAYGEISYFLEDDQVDETAEDSTHHSNVAAKADKIDISKKRDQPKKNRDKERERSHRDQRDDRASPRTKDEIRTVVLENRTRDKQKKIREEYLSKEEKRK